MQAIVQARYGGPEVLEAHDIDPPGALGGDEILVRVRAASVHADIWHVMRGRPYLMRLMGSGLWRPKQRVPGVDLSGVVEAVGAGVTRFAVGDEVFGDTVRRHEWMNGGSFAELAVARQDHLAHKPPGLSHVAAAGIPTSGNIAYRCLMHDGRLAAGAHVLINGAGGGVGSLAIQIAKAHGARVTAVDRADKHAMLRQLGADAVIDHERQDYTRASAAYDLILDIPGNHTFSECRRVLAPDGVYVLVGHDGYSATRGRWIGSVGTFLRLLPRTPFTQQLPRQGGAPSRPEMLAALRQLAAEGHLEPHVDRTYPLAQAAQAMRHLMSGDVKGRLILTIG